MRDIINKFGSVGISLIIAIGISLSGFFIGNSIKYFKNFDRYVEVKGLAETSVKSNQANWQIGFTASGHDLKDIYNTIDNQQEAISGFLLSQGFTINEIQKQPVSITDNYANAYSNNSKLAKYSANAGITVITKNPDKVTNAVQLTNKLVESGVVLNNNSVSYSFTELNNIKTSMLNVALSNAKIAAQQFATESQSHLGKIKNATQGLFTISSMDGNNNNDTSSIYKKVRVVTTVQFFLQ